MRATTGIRTFALPRTEILVVAGLALLWAGGCGMSAADSESAYSGGPASDRTNPPDNYQAGEKYEETPVTPFYSTDEKDTSTFSIDVDNGSYTLMRRDIRNRTLPTPEGVRAEEYINFFEYDYPEPEGEHPVAITSEVGPSPFGKEGMNLLRVGINAESIPEDDLAPANLVFLIDVSGSMQDEKKLPLVKRSLERLTEELDARDSVGIVVYAGSDGVVLEPTSGDQDQKIQSAIDKLRAGGSTNGEAGIVRAYEMAESARIEGGINRVLLATDGDFNVGKTGDELVDLIEEYRAKQISLTTLGYGSGNFNDGTMEKLARKGNGNYFYVDRQKEAERLFGPELASTLAVVAADVKIQVEFDSGAVERYRLIGYDNRTLNNDEFDDDSRDAGELGAGDTVTAYYEFEPTEKTPKPGQVAEIRLRYKDEYGEKSQKIVHEVPTEGLAADLKQATPDFRFGAAVAEYAEILRGSQYSEGARFGEIESMARSTAGDSERRQEFVDLVAKAAALY